MALDEALLESTAESRSLPTLRLYSWQPACLSLGHAQPFSDVDMQALAAHSWDLVRRPTGGRAILHTDELTYAVTGPQDEPRLSGSVLESYRVLSSALLQALFTLGIPAQAFPKHEGEKTASDGNLNPVCFEVPSNYEITWSGKKLIGSAQARRKAGVLQHGSLPLLGDLKRITQVLVFEDEEARKIAGSRLVERAVTAEQATGKAPTWQDTTQAFISAFEETLNLQLDQQEPSEAEIQRAKELENEKYAHPSWTERI